MGIANTARQLTANRVSRFRTVLAAGLGIRVILLLGGITLRRGYHTIAFVSGLQRTAGGYFADNSLRGFLCCVCLYRKRRRGQ